MVAQSLGGNLGIHDPSTVVMDNGRYYVYGTGQGIISKYSDNRVYWTAGWSVFPLSSPPAWTTTAVPGFEGFFWAPDIAYFNNTYHLYYSVSTWGSQVSAIGLATNTTLNASDPSYEWVDQGPVIQSTVGSNYNTIDPGIVQTPAGDVWMSFGSYWDGIYMVELDPATGLRISPGSPLYRVADHSSIEASYVYHKGDYYYLFVNWGTCCQGVDSTYNIRVGRGTNVNGPFYDQLGRDMVTGRGSLFLATEDQYIGPGHIAIFEDEGLEWFGYHYYDGNSNGAPTYNLRTLLWTEGGWPVPAPSSVPPPGDVNLDWTVDLLDFNVISDHLFDIATSRTAGDLNGDGIVDYADFRIWKNDYESGAASGTSSLFVPEPGTCFLVLPSGLFALRLRSHFGARPR